MCVHACVFACVRVCVYVCMRVYVCTCVYMCVCVPKAASAYAYSLCDVSLPAWSRGQQTDITERISISRCCFGNTYTHIDTRTHIHTHTHIHTYTHILAPSLPHTHVSYANYNRRLIRGGFSSGRTASHALIWEQNKGPGTT